MTGRGWKRQAVLLLLCVFSAACFAVEVTDDPAAVERRFVEARKELERLSGPRLNPALPDRLCLLAYDSAEKQLVFLELPLGLVETSLRHGLESTRGSRLLKADHGLPVACGVENLDRMGRGLLLDLEEAAGDRVLIWLK